jgi:hypothetical protein
MRSRVARSPDGVKGSEQFGWQTEPVLRLPWRRRSESVAHLVGIDERKSMLIISSYSKTTAGFHRMNGWFVLLPADSGDEEVGRSILRAREQCRSDVPVGNRERPEFREILKALGLRGVRQYMDGARSLLVEFGEAIKLTPTENRGRDGFAHLTDSIVKLPANDVEPAELGRHVREQLATSR